MLISYSVENLARLTGPRLGLRVCCGEQFNVTVREAFSQATMHGVQKVEFHEKVWAWIDLNGICDWERWQWEVCVWRVSTESWIFSVAGFTGEWVMEEHGWHGWGVTSERSFALLQRHHACWMCLVQTMRARLPSGVGEALQVTCDFTLNFA